MTNQHVPRILPGSPVDAVHRGIGFAPHQADSTASVSVVIVAVASAAPGGGLDAL